MKKLLAAAALVASGQALALPNINIQETVFENQYSLDFNTPSGILPFTETSGNNTINQGYTYGLNGQVDSGASVHVGTQNTELGYSLRVGVSDTQMIDELGLPPNIDASGFDFSASAALNLVFDVVDGPVTIDTSTFAEGPAGEYAFNLSGNGLNINESLVFDSELRESYTLTEGTYSLSTSLSLFETNEDPVGFDISFSPSSVSVPAPFTPLLALAGLVMLLRSRKVR